MPDASICECVCDGSRCVTMNPSSSYSSSTGRQRNGKENGLCSSFWLPQKSSSFILTLYPHDNKPPASSAAGCLLLCGPVSMVTPKTLELISPRSSRAKGELVVACACVHMCLPVSVCVSVTHIWKHTSYSNGVTTKQNDYPYLAPLPLWDGFVLAAPLEWLVR